MDVNLGPVAGQGIERQRRTKRRSADSDVDQVLDRPQQTGVDRLNQALGAQMQRRRLFNRGIAADPALGGASGKVFNPVGDGAVKEERIIDDMVSGAVNFWRRACWDQIGGYVPPKT